MWSFRLKLVLAAVAVWSCWIAPVWAQSAGDESASYRLTFRGTWTRSVTPGGVHRNAHFSPLIGAAHNDQVGFWEPGGRASPQLEGVAELGRQRNLRTLMERSRHVLAVLEKTPRRGGTASTTIEFETTRQFPLVTLVTMIAPSPDWFVGVSGQSLLDDSGGWVDDLEVDLFPYDAGTEEGTEFSLTNPATVPQGTITSIRGMGKFADAPMARLTFERLDPEEPGEPDPNLPEPRFTGDVTAEPVGDSGVIVFWRGSWADAERGLLGVEARSQTAGWAQVTTTAATDGRIRIDGLRPETPYTFRLRADGRQGLEHSEEASATTGGYSGPCRTGDSFLCLRQRFEVQVHWTDPDVAGNRGRGGAIPVPESDESGLFWFFDPENIELVVKVLDGRGIDGNYWVFFGALSDVEYWLTVRDPVGGLNRTYHNPPKRICGQSDTSAFPGGDGLVAGSATLTDVSGGLDLLGMRVESLGLDRSVGRSHGGGRCEPGPERLCVLDDRFAIELRFIDPNITDPGSNPETIAGVIPYLTTGETAFFWFFDPANIELAAKMLDGRALNGRFWLIYGGLSDVEYTLTVTDTVTGTVKTYRNESGSVCGRIDTDAF
ncbi:MAG: hypothetical protein F4210_02260 [Holophagales bacterium]|nr:hypothetical protein [Holophagales bacterium]MYF94334.1 hypothetical protein [Holophagales bacterium]